MIIAKVTTKGQITIPKKIREILGVHSGESIGFAEVNGQVAISKVVAESPFDKWVGKLEHLRGTCSDDIVREARGNDHGR